MNKTNLFMDIIELKGRIDTIYSVICSALLTRERYNEILKNASIFTVVFPGVEFENPKIQFSIDNNGEIFLATKNEFINEYNYDLFRAWQIALGITGMTAIMESYLKDKAEKLTGNTCNSMGIFYKFQRQTIIKLKDFENYDEINKYYQVRHIILHNLGRTDKKYINNVKINNHNEKPYVFYPIDLKRYKELIIGLAEYIEKNITTNKT